ncbi:MAG: hypothetical protein LBU61_03635 [Coriobacteriales bacterium]|jgi:hypothetical protein|nr:hypothetical protein [Coriobacteriales bacterium]
MYKKIWAIVKINFQNLKIPYFVTGLVCLGLFIESIVYTIIAAVSGHAGNQMQTSAGNYFWLLMILAAIFIPTRNFRRIANLGGKRIHFFWGSLASYVLLALAATCANTLFFYTYEQFLFSTGYFAGYDAFVQNPALMDTRIIVVNLIELFGWSKNGVLFVVVQQFVFLLLLAVVVHTITSMQDKWYGWAVDLYIATILSTFIPIASLRVWLLGFFNLIIFIGNPLIQISFCLLLALVIYVISWPVIIRKAI